MPQVNGIHQEGSEDRSKIFDETNPIPLIINNVDITTNTTFSITSPSTSKTLYKSSFLPVDGISKAVETSAHALPSWRAKPPTHRRDFLIRAASILESRADECISAMRAETGAPEPFCLFNIHTSASILRDIASRIVRLMNGTAPICEEADRSCVVVKEPIGVVLAIAPWNAPFILGIRAVASAIAGGNTCVLKGSELSPRCFWIIGDILRKAGCPKAVCNVVFARREDAGEVTKGLIEAKEVRKISFTGSTEVGRAIAETAGKALKPCLLELGGKAPAIVCEDADVGLAARECVKGALMHAGQVCMSTEKMIVHERVMNKFKEMVEIEVNSMFPDGGKMPLLVNDAGVEKNQRLCMDALNKGATFDHCALGEDCESPRMRPTWLENVTKDMDIFHTESFGPTFGILTFTSEKEALDLANDCDYGLNAAVFTKNLAKGLRLAKAVEAGNVHINSMTIHDEPNLPHGGLKNSGWGRFNADQGIEEFLVSKTITWKD